MCFENAKALKVKIVNMVLLIVKRVIKYLAIVYVVIIQGCDISVKEKTKETINLVPIANAGNEKSSEVNASVTLDASESFDEDDDQLSFLWTEPEGITLSKSHQQILRLMYQ